MHTKLEVDVHGHWSDSPPIYRIYVDNEMMIERTFGWPSYQNYITEHMYCDLDTGVHTLSLENLDTNSRFELDHFTLDKIRNNQPTVHHNLTINLAKVSTPTPLAPPVERPKKIVQVKKYETYAPLVQRMRQLNTKK
jgi:hypothetical protein